MNDFVNKYKNAQGGGNPKQQNKDNKKAVTKALHDTFKMAMQGQVAGIQHNGVQYVMMKHEVFTQVIQSGGKMLISDEQKVFHQHYQILMHLMQGLNMEVQEEADLFADIDQFTFDFSQHMNDPNGAKQRREILKEFKETIDGSKLLTDMEKNLRQQFFPDPTKEKEVENNGKLT